MNEALLLFLVWSGLIGGISYIFLTLDTKPRPPSLPPDVPKCKCGNKKEDYYDA